MPTKVAKGKTLKEIKELMAKEREENEGLSSFEIMKKRKKEKPYCLKCQNGTKEDFYKSRNINHSNGWLPYCKKCIEPIFTDYYVKMGNDARSALYLLCRLLDVPFILEYVEAAIEQNRIKMEKNPNMSEVDVYKSYMTILNTKLQSVVAENISFDDSELYIDAIKKVYSSSHFDFDTKFDLIKEKNKDSYEEQRLLEDLREKFGSQYTDKELFKLKKMYDKWQQENIIEDMSKESMVRAICCQQLRIDKQLEKNAAAGELKKEYEILNMLMTNAALRPKDKMAQDNNVSRNTIGMMIKDIETTRPADNLELKKKFAKWDNIQELIELYYVAPVLQSLGHTDNDYVRRMQEKNIKDGIALSKEDLLNAGVVVENNESDE